jgi:hypothetical protein
VPRDGSDFRGLSDDVRGSPVFGRATPGVGHEAGRREDAGQKQAELQ